MTNMTLARGIGRPRQLITRVPFLPALIILMLLVALNGLFEPNSLSLRSIRGLVSTYLALMLIAVAQTYVVFAGDIDLSIGAILSLVNVSIVILMEHWGGGALVVIGASIVGLAIGVACGIVNGVVVAGLRLQPIVATFATGIFFTGLALTIMPVAGTPAPAEFWRTYGGTVLGAPVVFLAFLAAAVLVYALSRSALVLRLLAVGDGQQAAFQSGLSVTGIRIRGYALAGFFAAVAALCITGDTASGDPLVGGRMTLYSVAAVVLGGTALSGGSGSVAGSIVGAFIIGLINSLVFFVGTPSEWQNLVQGFAILVALMVGILISRRVPR